MINLLQPSPEECGHLLLKWSHVIQAIGPNNVWDTRTELAWICECAAQSLDDMPRYLEVGAYRGASTKAVAMVNRRMQIVVLDTFDDEGTYDAFAKLLAPDISESRIQIITGPSSEGFKTLRESWSFRHERAYKFDFCFIDAGHTYDLVSQDIKDALPFMKPHGLIAGHDYRHDLPEDGVTKAVNELLPSRSLPVDSIWCHRLP